MLNADAWAVDNAVEQLAGFAAEHPQAAVVGPKLLNTDGSLQRSVRGFPTLWRLATEYFFLRKLAPRSHAFNAFYAGDFEHDETREVEFVMGACMLVRRDAIDAVGPPDSSVLPVQRGDRLVLPLPPGGLECALLSRSRRSST